MMILVAPTVTEEGLPTAVERVSGYVTGQGGEVESFTHDSPWGRRRLAYPIQKFQDAFYVLYYFYAPPSAISEIDRALRLDDQVIRHLIVKYDPLTERVGEAAPFDGEGGEAEAADEAAADGASAAAPAAETEETEETTTAEEETAAVAGAAEEDVPSDDDGEESA